MDSIVFHVDADKIGPNLAETIKTFFGNRRVQITVKADETAIDIPPADKAPDLDYALPYDDIARISAALDRNESIDMMAEMKRFIADK